MDESELREIRRAARRRQMTVSEWVRSALRAARRAEPGGEPGRRIAAIRAASRHAFPTADIDQMQAEIEQGRAERGR
jgi:hypothetical protein